MLCRHSCLLIGCRTGVTLEAASEIPASGSCLQTGAVLRAPASASHTSPLRASLAHPALGSRTPEAHTPPRPGWTPRWHALLPQTPPCWLMHWRHGYLTQLWTLQHLALVPKLVLFTEVQPQRHTSPSPASLVQHPGSAHRAGLDGGPGGMPRRRSRLLVGYFTRFMRVGRLVKHALQLFGSGQPVPLVTYKGCQQPLRLHPPRVRQSKRGHHRLVRPVCTQDGLQVGVGHVCRHMGCGEDVPGRADDVGPVEGQSRCVQCVLLRPDPGAALTAAFAAPATNGVSTFGDPFCTAC